MRVNTFYIFLVFIFTVNSSLRAQNLQIRIDSIGNELLKKSETIGAYVSIQKGDSIIYSSSFGYNDIKTKSRWNDSTLFPISSNTKAFNSILLSQLAEKGKLDFENPIIKYLPDLNLKDNYLSQNLTLMDLLTHRWGIPRYDFTYYMLTDEEKKNANEVVVNKLKYLESNAPFRTNYQYGNNQYILAAYLLENITGNKWEEQLNKEILNPLGMSSTHCDLNQFLKSKNRSIGYQNKKEVDIQLASPLYDVSGMGNMFSTVQDLQKWTSFLINGNDSILSKDYIDFNLSSQFNVGFEEPFEGFSSITYGLGWYIFDYYGHKVVLHHGDNMGQQSLIMLFPEDELSFIIVGNDGMKSIGFPFYMGYTLMDVMFHQKVNDWYERLSPRNEMEKIDSSSTLIKPDIPLKDYQGDFVHEGFGTIKIFISDKKLIVKAGAYQDELTYIENNKFKAYSKEFQSTSLFKFKLNDKKEIISFDTDLIEPSVEMIEFKKK